MFIVARVDHLRFKDSQKLTNRYLDAIFNIFERLSDKSLKQNLKFQNSFTDNSPAFQLNAENETLSPKKQPLDSH